MGFVAGLQYVVTINDPAFFTSTDSSPGYSSSLSSGSTSGPIKQFSTSKKVASPIQQAVDPTYQPEYLFYQNFGEHFNGMTGRGDGMAVAFTAVRVPATSRISEWRGENAEDVVFVSKSFLKAKNVQDSAVAKDATGAAMVTMDKNNQPMIVSKSGAKREVPPTESSQLAYAAWVGKESMGDVLLHRYFVTGFAFSPLSGALAIATDTPYAVEVFAFRKAKFGRIRGSLPDYVHPGAGGGTAVDMHWLTLQAPRAANFVLTHQGFKVNTRKSGQVGGNVEEVLYVVRTTNMLCTVMWERGTRGVRVVCRTWGVGRICQRCYGRVRRCQRAMRDVSVCQRTNAGRRM